MFIKVLGIVRNNTGYYYNGEHLLLTMSMIFTMKEGHNFCNMCWSVMGLVDNDPNYDVEYLFQV